MIRIIDITVLTKTRVPRGRSIARWNIHTRDTDARTLSKQEDSQGDRMTARIMVYRYTLCGGWKEGFFYEKTGFESRV